MDSLIFLPAFSCGCSNLLWSKYKTNNGWRAILIKNLHLNWHKNRKNLNCFRKASEMTSDHVRPRHLQLCETKNILHLTSLQPFKMSNTETDHDSILDLMCFQREPEQETLLQHRGEFELVAAITFFTSSLMFPFQVFKKRSCDKCFITFYHYKFLKTSFIYHIYLFILFKNIFF